MIFCLDHRLPELHSCTSIAKVKDHWAKKRYEAEHYKKQKPTEPNKNGKKRKNYKKDAVAIFLIIILIVVAISAFSPTHGRQIQKIIYETYDSIDTAIFQLTPSKSITQTYSIPNLGNITIIFPEKLVDHYKNKAGSDNYNNYVNQPKANQFFIYASNQILKNTPHARTDWDKTQVLLYFVQSLEYEYWHKVNIPLYYPVWTLYYKRGLCGDKTILLATLLKAQNIEAVLILIPDMFHIGIGVPYPETYLKNNMSFINKNGIYYEGKWYAYGETTNPSWILGEMPEDCIKKTHVVIPIY